VHVTSEAWDAHRIKNWLRGKEATKKYGTPTVPSGAGKLGGACAFNPATQAHKIKMTMQIGLDILIGDNLE